MEVRADCNTPFHRWYSPRSNLPAKCTNERRRYFLNQPINLFCRHVACSKYNTLLGTRRAAVQHKCSIRIRTRDDRATRGITSPESYDALPTSGPGKQESWNDSGPILKSGLQSFLSCCRPEMSMAPMELHTSS